VYINEMNKTDYAVMDDTLSQDPLTLLMLLLVLVVTYSSRA